MGEGGERRIRRGGVHGHGIGEGMSEQGCPSVGLVCFFVETHRAVDDGMPGNHDKHRLTCAPGRIRCKSYQLANFFPARTVAVAVLSHVLRKRGLEIEEDIARWVNDITSGKVDYRDFEEVVEILEKQDEE